MTTKHHSDPRIGSEARDIIGQLLDAALSHVPFDGWSAPTFASAVEESRVAPALADVLCPRGAVDLAVAFHKRGDQLMLERLATESMIGLRFRDKIALAVRLRLEIVEDKEAVRRGTTLFALPQYTGDGVGLIWGTANAIWLALGDSSEDINWYTKRGTLTGVYSSTVLYWLGDDSPGHQASWDFLDRRIDNVMQFEKLKAQVQSNPLLKPLLTGPNWLAKQVKAPSRRDDLPGRWTTSRR
ncbi:COQ9 family protein [Phaeobacter sp. C3_T13_0]|uniref:COQ9 family protein n=1 Tax=Phaeobacter cretensis TaxID=3342641 RepID=UPI0039BC45FA